MRLPASIQLCEVGLRDGLQNENRILDTAEKVQITRDLITAGFRVIELGSFMHPKAVPQMANTDEVFQSLKQETGIEFRALVPNLRGVQRAVDSGCRKVKLNVSASRGHNLANLNMTPEQSVAGFAESVDYAREHGLEVSGSISMPFGSPWEGETPIEDVFSIIEAYLKLGVHEISLSDASGMAVPNQVYRICETVSTRYSEAVWWLHFHNTRGVAMANILAAMQAGITRFDSSFGGLGGCPFVPGAAGNIATEDVVHMMDEMGIETGIDLNACMAIARNIQQLVGHDTDSYLLRAGSSKDLLRD